MKHITIDLTTFLNFGGSLDKFPLKFARTTYSDKNQGKTIESIQRDGHLFRIFYSDGTNHVYSGRSIESTVEFVLDQKYL